MTEDIIEEAKKLEEQMEEAEYEALNEEGRRKAVGFADGHKIRLVKIFKQGSWRLEVRGDNDISIEPLDTEEQADQHFEELVEKYDLKES